MISRVWTGEKQVMHTQYWRENVATWNLEERHKWMESVCARLYEFWGSYGGRRILYYRAVWWVGTSTLSLYLGCPATRPHSVATHETTTWR
jgi:hypothetical protein